MAYRLYITGAESSPNKQINMAIEVQVDASGSWVTIPNGTRDFLLSAIEVVAITDGDGTDAEKRTALVDLLKKDVVSWGLVQSDYALAQIEALIPGGFPITISL